MIIFIDWILKTLLFTRSIHLISNKTIKSHVRYSHSKFLSFRIIYIPPLENEVLLSCTNDAKTLLGNRNRGNVSQLQRSCNRGLGKYISRRGNYLVTFRSASSERNTRRKIHSEASQNILTIVLTDGPPLYYVLYYVDRKTISCCATLTS